MDISQSIKFCDICAMLEKVKKAKNQAVKEKILQRYYESFQKFRQIYRKEHGIAPAQAEDGSTSFYSVLRCLIPREDTVRKPYGMQITSLGRVYIKVLQLSEDSPDAKRLHARSFSSIRGDYADIVYSVLFPRCKREVSNLTLHEVHQMLDTIAEDDRRNTEMVLTRLAEVASAQEQMWFIRLLLKNMHLGIGEQRIFALLHPQAKELQRRCSNLTRVCCLLADNKIDVVTDEDGQLVETKAAGDTFNLDAVIEPFQHIRPMLCEVFQGNIAQLMADDVLYVETKMDGERFQLHYADARFKYISRNGNDYTYSFGENYETGKLTPRLEYLLPTDMQSLILDGEMMVYDTRTKSFREKSENTDVKHLAAHIHLLPCFVIYDILYFNGESLLHMPYVQRAQKITELFKERPTVLQIMRPIKVTSVEQFQGLFQQALNSNAEGVVLKKQNSVYRPGVRNGGGWYKIKADYIKGLTTEFDVLIIGGFYNRARTFMHSFLVGVLKYQTAEQFEVYSVGKVTNNIRQRVVLNDALKPYWHQLQQEPPPTWYHYEHANAEGRPDVWIEPQNSVIVQIKATDLTRSSAFALSKSLHFPRIEAWRNDKVWQECLSLQDYMQMCQGQQGIKKIHKREVNLEDFTQPQKRQKLTPAVRRKLGMLSYERRFNADEVQQNSNLFDGFSFCILSACLKDGYTPEDLKALVVRNGGTIVENPIQDEKCISVAGDITFRVETLQKSRRYNIASLAWLVRVCERQELQLTPRDMLCVTDELKREFAELYDKYSDSYREHVSVEDLELLLEDISEAEIAESELPTIDNEEIQSLMYDDNGVDFFNNCNACFYSDELRSEVASLTFQWRGGNCVNSKLDDCKIESIHYIFINVDGIEKTSFNAWLLKNFKSYLKNVQIVNIDWIMHSHKAKRKLDVLEYTWHEF